MNAFDRYSTGRERKFPLGYALIATPVAIVTLAVFARDLVSAPIPQRQPVVQIAPEPLAVEITPSPVMGFGPGQMATGDGLPVTSHIWRKDQWSDHVSKSGVYAEQIPIDCKALRQACLVTP
jgi:hypothetical protein